MAVPDLVREYIGYNRDTGVLFWLKNRGMRGVAGREIKRRNPGGYAEINFAGKSYLAHRIIWWLVFGAEPDGEIDHINGNRADNRLSNLRLADRAQNARNCKVRSTSSTGVKGVSRDRNTFRASCYAKGVRHYLGNYKTIEAAETAVREFREKNHNEFCNHG